MKPLLLFLRSLWRHWRAGLTGGAPVALLALYVYATTKSLSQPWGWGIIGATFVSAAFAGWKSEKERGDSFEQQLRGRLLTLKIGGVALLVVTTAVYILGRERLRAHSQGFSSAPGA